MGNVVDVPKSLILLFSLRLQRSGPDRAAGGLRTQPGRRHVAEAQLRRVPIGRAAVRNRNRRSGRRHALPHGPALDLGNLARVRSLFFQTVLHSHFVKKSFNSVSRKRNSNQNVFHGNVNTCKFATVEFQCTRVL